MVALRAQLASSAAASPATIRDLSPTAVPRHVEPWGAKVRENFRQQQQPAAQVRHSQPAVQASTSAQDSPQTQRRNSSGRMAQDNDLALALAHRKESEALLEEVRKERELIAAESRKIEEANAIIQVQYDELVAAQEAFERKKMGPIVVEMGSQTDEGHSIGCQTDSSLLEPLVSERALAAAADKAEAADSAFQTHGVMWLKNASQAVHDEARSLLALLASRMEVPAPPRGAPRTLPYNGAPPSAKLQQTWRHALTEEIHRALEPLRERISTLEPPAAAEYAFAPSADLSRVSPDSIDGYAEEPQPPPQPPQHKRPHRRPHTASGDGHRQDAQYGQVLPPWLLDRSGTPQVPPQSARAHTPTPSVARRTVLASAAGAPAPRRVGMQQFQYQPVTVGGRVPGTTPNMPIRLHGEPQSARNAARALAWSQVDKHAARELAAMRQILRAQRDLLPLVG